MFIPIVNKAFKGPVAAVGQFLVENVSMRRERQMRDLFDSANVVVIKEMRSKATIG